MFVTFEGTEGSGKSSALKAIAERLRSAGREVVTTREPGAGDFGREIRKILLYGEELDPRAELFLFLADRAQHCRDVVRGSLVDGKTVLCDRYIDSTVAYQGHARGLDVSEIRELNTIATVGLKPDLTLLFDLDVEIGLKRLLDKDRLDNEPLEFHQKVREGYLAEMENDPARWIKIDASQPADIVVEQCWEALSSSPAFLG